MAAGGNSSYVELGPGRLYAAAVTTTEPASATAVLAASAWYPIGYTEQGSAFQATLTQSEVDVEEEIDPIKYVLSKRVGQVTLAMAEMRRANLALAFGAGAGQADDGTTFEPPDPGTEVAVVLVWDSDEADTPGTDNTRYLFRQCKAGGTISIPRRKAPNKATIATTFNLEKPTGKAPFKVFPALAVTVGKV